MNPKELLQKTIEAEPSIENLSRVVKTLKHNGLSKEQVMEIFDATRALHEHDEDEAIYNNILDTMDLIAGWCRRDRALFPEKPA